LPPTKKANPKIVRKSAQEAPRRGSKPKTASEQPRTIAAWERGARIGFKRSLYVAVPVLLWMLLSLLGLLSVSLNSNLVLCFSVLVFVLAIPLSILFGLHTFALNWAPESSNETIMLVFVLVLCLNFTLVGCLRGLLRGDEEQKNGPSGRRHRG